jgi:hypothetical protein
MKAKRIPFLVTWTSADQVAPQCRVSSSYPRIPGREVVGLIDVSGAVQKTRRSQRNWEQFELPEADRAAAVGAIAEERERSRSYLRDWYSEDATAIVWQQEESGEDYRAAIETVPEGESNTLQFIRRGRGTAQCLCASRRRVSRP